MRRRHRVAVEAAGVLLAGAWGVILVAHALAGAKRSLMLDDGDSVLLPLMVQSAHRGLALEWGMSPVLFLFPELPLYLASAAVTTTVAAALVLNGVLNVTILYGLLRAVAGRVTATRPALRRPGAPVVAALGALAVFGVASLCESREGGNTGEIVSLFLTTTYYSGTVMALLGAVALTLHLTREAPARSPARDGTITGRRIPVALLALAAVSAPATLSNPLFVLWATAPLAVALAALAGLRRSPAPLVTALALVVGSAIGYLGRQPLQRFIIADKTEYLRWHGQAASLRFFTDALGFVAATPGGVVELALGAATLATVVAATVVRLGRGRQDPATVAGLVAFATVVVVPLGLLLTGSLSTRYAMPLVFTPVAALAAYAGEAAGSIRRAGPRRVTAVVAAVAVLATLVVAVPATGRTVTAGRGLGDPRAACLTDWARGKDVAGVAQFWTGRALQAYGGDDVTVLQVNSDLSVYPWLVDLAAYRSARVGYVVVATAPLGSDHVEGWGDSVTALGTPRDTVHCDGYDIVDFRGTPGEKALTSRVDESARVQAALRGFGW